MIDKNIVIDIEGQFSGYNSVKSGKNKDIHKICTFYDKLSVIGTNGGVLWVLLKFI